MGIHDSDMSSAHISALSCTGTTAVARLRCFKPFTPIALSSLRLKCRTPFRSSTPDHIRCASVNAASVGSNMLQGLKRAFTKEPKESLQQGSASTFTDNASSWENLQQRVRQQQQELGWTPPDLENGATNSRALNRTFGKSDGPQLKLYRDSASWCPYCQKVWVQLEEKQIPYEIEKINMRCYGDKPASYTAKVPSGLLPALELDGQLYTESDLIMRVLEERFPEKPMLPSKGSSEYHRAQSLLRLERQLFGVWLQWLCRSWNHKASMSSFMDTMGEVDAQLADGGGPFFLGQDMSLVDCVFAPFLERINASIPYYKGVQLRGSQQFPHLDRWFEAMEKKPSYLGTKSDFYTHVHDLPPQLGGCVSVPEAKEMAAAIDGTDGRSWHLPLPPLTPTSLEPHSPGERPDLDRLQAAHRLVDNHEAVVKFAARGCGQEGSQPVMAPLSDPSAKPGMQYLQAVDAGMRHVAEALLNGPEQATQTLREGQQGADANGALPGQPVCAAAAYLRDRVGVPRDLPLPAARQLRAHLNWLIDELQQ